MKKRIERKQLLIYLIILSLLLVLNFTSIIYAQDISTEGVTTIVEGLDPESTFDSIKKIYEIGPSSLEKGYSATLNEKDAFKLDRIDKSYYIIVWNITDKDVVVIFPRNRILSFGLNDLIIVDVNQDNKLDIILELKSIELINKDVEKVQNRKANFYIKKLVEKELIPEGDYFELFDVTVRLAEETIYNIAELETFITFENFGEGPSEIDIVYSIINEKKEEVYRGVDSKVVQTEDLVVKNFNFLKLPLGKYILRTEIFYGKNQTGDSEQDFEIIKEPFLSVFRGALIFIGSLIILFTMIVYLRKRYKMNPTVKEIYKVKKGDKKIKEK